VVGEGKACFSGRGMGVVRRREEVPEWGRNPPLQPRAVDKGARGGARGRRPRQSSGRHRMAEQLACAREASYWAPFKWPLSLIGGPQHFFIYQYFQTPTHSYSNW
jgi:hypothetical protein